MTRYTLQARKDMRGVVTYRYFIGTYPVEIDRTEMIGAWRDEWARQLNATPDDVYAAMEIVSDIMIGTRGVSIGLAVEYLFESGYAFPDIVKYLRRMVFEIIHDHHDHNTVEQFVDLV